MKVLVTGGAGYIGGFTAERLSALGHEVVVIDNLCTGHRGQVPAGVKAFVEADVADQETVGAALAEHGIEALVHFAASAEVGESVANPEKYFKNNLRASLRLLEACRAHGVDKVVFSSTAATYGVPESMPILEDSPQLPCNPYGFTKYAFEQALRAYHHAYGTRSVILRYFNASGGAPDGSRGEDHRPESHLIPIVLQVALGQREHIKIFGSDYPTPDGSCVRDYIHVLDLAEAHVLGLEKLAAGAIGCEAFNLGNGNGFSVREVIEVCRKVTGHPIPAVDSARRPGDPPTLVASSAKARELLGWNPQYPELEAIVASAWAWHQKHPQGYGEKG